MLKKKKRLSPIREFLVVLVVISFVFYISLLNLASGDKNFVGQAGKNPPKKCTDSNSVKHNIGESWRVDCNTCSCKTGGKIICTKKLCPNICKSTNSLSKGQTKLFAFDNLDYEIKATLVNPNKARFIVNGENTSFLSAGSTYTLADGSNFSLLKILKNKAYFCINGVAGKEKNATCTDSDGGRNYSVKGIINSAKFGPSSAAVEWKDLCLKDYDKFLKGEYVPPAGITKENGLLEGSCGPNINEPGVISTYKCPNICEDGKCVPCSEDIFILKENYSGQFLFPPNQDPYWHFKYSEILKEFNKTHDFIYDFVVSYSTADIGSASSSINQNNISGIGFEIAPPFYKFNSLKSIIQMGGYNVYKLIQPNDTGLQRRVLAHEIGHNWCCALRGFYNNDTTRRIPGHWINNLDLFYGDQNFVDINAYNHWIIKNGTKQCVNINNVNNRFSDLTLYLMGLLPPTDVAPIKVHDYVDNPNFTSSGGPECYDNPVFTDTREISMQDIINANGKRIPGYEDSQKNFRAAFMVIVPYNQTIDMNFVDYVKKQKDEFQITWPKVTNFKSEMTTCIR